MNQLFLPSDTSSFQKERENFIYIYFLFCSFCVGGERIRIWMDRDGTFNIPTLFPVLCHK